MKKHTLGTAALFLISLLSALQANASTPQKALFCWSAPDHPIGTHAYEQFTHSMTALFSRIDNIEAQGVRGFPSDEQWADSDLVVFFLTQNRLTDSQFAQIDKHLEQGKSILALHQGLVQRGSHNQWAERIGFAFNWEEGEERSKWGKFNNHRITLDTSAEIFSDLPPSITFSDELYWNLKKGSRGEITILGETTAPGVDETQTNQKWPILWTVQHPSTGNADGGRAFGAVLGHFNEMRDSPIYQAILLRGIAWCLREPFAPFNPQIRNNDPELLFPDGDLSAFKNAGDWSAVSDLKLAPDNPKRLVGKESGDAVLNGPKGKTSHLITGGEFGDVEAHIEFMISEKSNSGIYFMGRYEVQIYDSHGVEKDKYPGLECGGIYPRWIGGKNVEGHSPMVNASRPAGEWQTFDVIFRAPRFDKDGKKTENASFVKVWHNGKLIHENVELKGPTRAGIADDERPTGPLMLQGNHGPVAYRNVWVTVLGEKHLR